MKINVQSAAPPAARTVFVTERPPLSGSTQVASPRQNVLELAPVPLFRFVTGRLPVTSAESDTAAKEGLPAAFPWSTVVVVPWFANWALASVAVVQVGAALRVSNSSVSLFRTLVFGGDGGYGFGECPGGAAGEGAVIENGSTVFGMYDYFEGGDGGGSDDYIAPVCAPGEPGVCIEAGSVLHEQACIFVGGKGGYSWVFDEYCDDAAGIEGAGTVEAILGNHRALIAPRVVREGEHYDLEIYGLAGDRAYVFWSPTTDAVFQPRRYGVWLLFGRGLAKYQALGTLNGNGYLKVPMVQPELGVGVQEHLMYAQLIVRDVAGIAFIGSPVAIQALDSGF